MLDTPAVAARLGRSVRTLKRWRKEKVGPPYVRTETGGVLYDEAELEKWLKDRTVAA